MRKPPSRPLEEAKQLLEAEGYVVRPKRALVKHTFEVDPKLLKEFFQVQESLKLKVKDAVAEALSAWIAVRKK